MKVKEYLSQALWLDQKINSKLEQLETLRALATKVTAKLAEENLFLRHRKECYYGMPMREPMGS